jgi:hypothetical protein
MFSSLSILKMVDLVAAAELLVEEARDGMAEALETVMQGVNAGMVDMCQ